MGSIWCKIVASLSDEDDTHCDMDKQYVNAAGEESFQVRSARAAASHRGGKRTRTKKHTARRGHTRKSRDRK
jgi:hypothetical protein